MLQFYDNLICFIFLIDFALRLRVARIRGRSTSSRSAAGSTCSARSRRSASPSGTPGLFRLARLSRLARILRLMRGKQRKELARDVLENRGKYALVHHGAVDDRRARHGERARAAVRDRDRRRPTSRPVGRVLVQHRHDHDGRLRRLLPGHRRAGGSRRCSSCSPASGSSAPWPASSPACSSAAATSDAPPSRATNHGVGRDPHRARGVASDAGADRGASRRRTTPVIRRTTRRCRPSPRRTRASPPAAPSAEPRRAPHRKPVRNIIPTTNALATASASRQSLTSRIAMPGRTSPRR